MTDEERKQRQEYLKQKFKEPEESIGRPLKSQDEQRAEYLEEMAERLGALKNRHKIADIIAAVAGQYRARRDLTMFTNPDYDMILKVCDLERNDGNIYLIGWVTEMLRQITEK